MEKSENSINVKGGFLFCGGCNFSKSVSVGPTFTREMRVISGLSFELSFISMVLSGFKISLKKTILLNFLEPEG